MKGVTAYISSPTRKVEPPSVGDVLVQARGLIAFIAC